MLEFMDDDGFVSIDKVLQTFNGRLTIGKLQDIVDKDQKGRFEIFGDKVRATNGHSIPIKNIGEKIDPPGVLYHLTSKEAVDQIMKEGLNKQSRIYIHFHAQLPTRTRKRNTLLIITPPKDLEFFRIKNGYIVCRDVIPPSNISVERQNTGMR